ncbi:MAG: SDR family oxidoreductase [Methylotetracoccus sp.]
MRVLVTGAGGFVGRHLCRTLRSAGFSVRAAVRREVELPDVDEVVAVGSIDEQTSWHAALRNVDFVAHLAARVHVLTERLPDPLEEFRRVNVAGTEHLARSAACSGVRRFVFVSSIKVNGESTSVGEDFSEASVPRPQDPYGMSKWEAEQALAAVGSDSGMEIVCVRPPLVYGPGVGANFRSMMRWVARGLPLPLAAVRNRRSLVYIGNLTDALARCLLSSRAAGQTFMVCDGEDLSTPDLIRRVARALSVRPRLIAVPPAVLRFSGSMLHRQPAVSRLTESLCVDGRLIRTELGWSSPFSVDQGLAETADWFRRSG